MKPFLTIVSGLPRSGTSMMMRMLEAGGLPALTDNIRVADVDNPRGYYEFEPAKKTKDDPSWLEGADGKVVKMVYQLLYELPADREYRVIFLRREMSEVLASQRKMLQRLGRDDGGIADEKMAALFRSQLDKFESWAKDQSHLKILEVNYNQMVEAPQPHVEAINAFLDGDLNVEAMVAVVEPDLYRNRSESKDVG
jgi:hypothetical protein